MRIYDGIPTMRDVVEKVEHLVAAAESGDMDGISTLLSTLPLSSIKSLVGASKTTRHADKLSSLIAKQAFLVEVRFFAELQNATKCMVAALGDTCYLLYIMRYTTAKGRIDHGRFESEVLNFVSSSAMSAGRASAAASDRVGLFRNLLG